MATFKRTALVLGCVLVFSVQSLPASAQRGAVPDVSAAPGVFAERAISACSTAINARIQASGGVLADTSAGSEQDGYFLVSGRVIWRGNARAGGTFACVWQRAGNRVAALDVPDPPGGADPGRDGRGGATGGGRPVSAELITACTEAVSARIQRDYRVMPSLQGPPSLEQRGDTAVLSGAGAYSAGPASSTGRSAGQRAFTYVCELNLAQQTLTNVVVRTP